MLWLPVSGNEYKTLRVIASRSQLEYDKKNHKKIPVLSSFLTLGVIGALCSLSSEELEINDTEI